MQGWQSATLDSKKFAKNWEKEGKKSGNIGKKEEKSGRKGKNREGSFTLPLLTDRAGYATVQTIGPNLHCYIWIQSEIAFKISTIRPVTVQWFIVLLSDFKTSYIQSTIKFMVTYNSRSKFLMNWKVGNQRGKKSNAGSISIHILPLQCFIVKFVL